MTKCFVWLCLFLATLPQKVLDDPDVYWHIKTGNYILAHGWPRVDVFSYTAAGHPWIDQEWLAQIIYAITYNLGGWLAIDVLAAALIATTFTIVFSQIGWDNHSKRASHADRVHQRRQASQAKGENHDFRASQQDRENQRREASQADRENPRERASHPPCENQTCRALVITAIAFWFADTHFLARPHLFGMICLALFTANLAGRTTSTRASHGKGENHHEGASHLERENHRKRASRNNWENHEFWASHVNGENHYLWALVALWSNLHGSFVLSVPLALGFGRPVLAIGCAVAGLLNPYGWGYYEMAWWQVEHMAVMQQVIAELRPVSAIIDWQRVAVLCAAWGLIAWRGRLAWNRAAMLSGLTFAALQHFRGLTFLAILAPLIAIRGKSCESSPSLPALR